MTFSTPLIPDMRAWWTASDSARSHWSAVTEDLLSSESCRVLEEELRRILIEDLERSPGYASSLILARPRDAEVRRWLLNAIAFYSARAGTGF